MQKNLFITQKVVFVIYATLMILLFVYALGFMTDFKELFGQSNSAIRNFHDETLQGFNREVFWVGIIGVISFVIFMVLEIKDKVADYFALGFVGVFGLFNVISGIMFIPKLLGLKEEYLGLNFDSLLLADGQVYNITTRIFDMGLALYIAVIIISLVLIVVTSLNTGLFIKLNKGEGEIYE